MKKILIGSLVIFALAGCGMEAGKPVNNSPNMPDKPDQNAVDNTPDDAMVMCTMEAKQCPDGSYVGRGGPKCEFAACPSTGAAINNPIVIGSGMQVPATTNQTYKNSAYKFQFDYDKDFSFVNANYANLEEKIVQVELPGSIFPKTNLSNAGFAVSMSTSKNEKECLTVNLPEGVEAFTKKTTINGQEFFTANGNGAGAGNFYESKNYRAFVGTSCFEINETIHTANIGNFDPGTVTEVDKDAVWKKLDAITASFKFTK